MEWKTTTEIELDGSNSDLVECRNRLDAGVEENRRNRQVIEEINEKLARIRRRTAEEDAVRAMSTSHLDLPPGNQWHFSSINNIHDVGYGSAGSYHSGGGAAVPLSVSLVGLDGAGVGPHTPSTMMANTLVIPIRTEVEHRNLKHHRSSPTLHLIEDELYSTYDQDAVERLLYRLNQESYKNDTLEEVISMLRSEAQAAQAANQMLRADVSDINRALETVQAMRRNEQLAFEEENSRSRRRNEEQNRRIIELFHAIKAHRRQVADLRETTKSELDRQLTEFKRAASLMQTAMADKNSSQRDDDSMQEMVVKYEKMMEKNLETEKEKSKQILKLESSLKKAAEERDTVVESLGRIARMPELSDGHRTRSVSPTGASSYLLSGSGHLEIQRKIRAALTTKASEGREMVMRAERAEKEVDRLKKSLDKAEHESRSSQDEKRAAEQREKKRLHDFSELERSLRRSSDRVSSLEEEKKLMEEEVERLQRGLSEALKSHKLFIEELSSRHREEITDRVARSEGETAERIAEMKSKLDRHREDSERERSEGDRVRQSLRDTVAQLAVTTKKCDEYANKISILEEERIRLRSEIERVTERMNESEKTILDLRITIDERTESETKLIQRITELNSSESSVKEESETIAEELRELKKRVEELMRNEEKHKAVQNDLRSKHSSTEEALHQSEKTVKNLRLVIVELEKKLEEKSDEHSQAVADLEKNISRFDMATKDLLEVQETLMDFASERDTLAEALSALKMEHSSAEVNLAQAERRLGERTQEESNLQSQLEIALYTVKKLEEELAERSRQLDMTKDQLTALDGNFKRQDIGHAEELKKIDQRVRDEMATIVEEMETKLRILRSEKSALEETLSSTEKKLTEIMKMHDQLMDSYSHAQSSVSEWREKAEKAEVERRRERNELVEANAIDREEWESEREKYERQRNNSMSELRDELSRMENDLKETSSALDRMIRERDEAVDEIETMKRRIEETKREGERQREASLAADAAHTNERHTLIARLEEAILNGSKTQSLLDQTERKQRTIEEDLVNSQRMLGDKSKLLIEVETSLDGLLQKLKEAEIRENDLKDSLSSLERERDDWKRGEDERKKHQHEVERREHEMKERLLSLERDLHLTRTALDQERFEKSGGKDRMGEMVNKVTTLERLLITKSTHLESVKKQMESLEEERRRMREKGEKEEGQTAELVRANETLRRTVTQMKEELMISNKSLDERTSTSKHAMDELLLRFRETDLKLGETSTECERLRNTVHSLNTKLERMESSRVEIERKLSASESRRNEMEARLNAYERSARNALNLARPHSSIRFPTGGVSTVDLSSKPPLPLRNSHSSHDLHQYESGLHFDSSTGNLDVSASVDVTIRFLKDRIDRLEAERTAMAAQLGDHSRCAIKIEELQNELDRMQRRVQEVEEEKKHVEGRLHSQRQLYLSHEESIASKEREGRTLRNKLAATELRVRERESHLQQITTQLETVRTELIEMTTERNRMVERCRQTEDLIARVEEEKHSIERRREEMGGSMERMEREMQSLSKRLEDSDSSLSQWKRQAEKLRMELDLERESVEKLRGEEEHWRNTAHTVKKSADEYRKTMLDKRLAILQRSYDELNARNEKVVEEAERLRKEVREATSRATSAVQKSAESERRYEEVAESRKALHARLLGFERKEGDWLRTEKELGEEVKALRKDKLSLTSENEDLKRKIARLDVERREIDVNRTRLEREIIALKKHVETLEEERNRREISLKEALGERKAIDKSLATMEKENAELYRSCTTLQSQITQLEREAGGPRSIAKLLKDHADLEAKIGRINAEKRQVELTFASRETNHAHKQRMLESQVSMLKDQLESERRRRMHEPRKSGERKDRPTTSVVRKSSAGYRS